MSKIAGEINSEMMQANKAVRDDLRDLFAEMVRKTGRNQSVIDRVIYEIAQLRTENERLKAELAEAKKDAERWKYARRKMCFTGNGDGTCMMHGINLPAAIPGWPDPGKVEEFCDAAIDAAMKGK